MSRLLALEWDTRELRIVAGRASGSGIVVEQALSVELSDVADEKIGPQLSVAVSEHGLARGEAFVAVPRGKAELRLLTVPPTPDNELPELVRFQALRQFSSIGEDWPLDFIRLSSPDEPQCRVLAAAISTGFLSAVRSACEAAQLTPKRLILRPCASAALLQRGLPDTRCRLLVELLTEEVDLTVLLAGQVVFLRSVRLPSDELATALVGEIRRTVAAAQNQLGEQRVEQVVLCGGDAAMLALADQLRGQLLLEVVLFDPFAAVEVTRGSTGPSHPGRFAALLGMLHEEATGGRPGIDFLNPRRKPVPPDRRRQYAWVGAGAAMLALMLTGIISWQLRSYDQSIGKLQHASQGLDKQVKDAEELRTRVSEIDTFVTGDINWLDEVYDLSVKLPPAEQAIVEQATFSSRPGGGGQIVLEGYVRDPATIEALETALRDERHQVVGSGGQFDEHQDEYRWRFKETILIAAPDIEEVAAHE
jgi:hypothetical protein